MSVAAAVLLVLIAVMHSVIGERLLLSGVLEGRWRTRLPHRYARRMLRGGWHLTSIAWVGLAATLLGASPAVVVGAVCLPSAVVVAWCVPGHVAWPFFTAAGVLALAAAGAVPDTVLAAVVMAAVVAALVAAGFHVAWAAGSTRGRAAVIPQRRGTTEPLGRPGPVPTLGVAGALVVYVVVVSAAALGAEGPWWTVCGVAALVVLALRVIGDGRYLGVTKRVRDTPFGRADDRFWTPVVALLGLGAAGALALA